MQHVLFGLVFLYAVLPPGNSGRQDTVHGQNSALVDSKYPIEKCAVVFHQDFVPQLNIRKLRFGAETKPGLQEQWGKIIHSHGSLFVNKWTWSPAEELPSPSLPPSSAGRPWTANGVSQL